MKRLLLILITVLLAIPAVIAQSNRGMIRVRLSDNTPIEVAVDGRMYDQRNRVITVGNLPPGRHSLTVYRVDDQRRRTVVYQGRFRVGPGTFSYIVVDRLKGTVRVNTRDIEPEDMEISRPGRSDYPGPVPTERVDHRNHRDILPAEDMHDLRRNVESRITDSDKLKLMKSVLGDRRYDTEQVILMAGWLNFESSRLEFAKFAYKNVVDPRNYWKLEEVFSFSSTKGEFQRFLEGGAK